MRDWQAALDEINRIVDEEMELLSLADPAARENDPEYDKEVRRRALHSTFERTKIARLERDMAWQGACAQESRIQELRESMANTN